MRRSGELKYVFRFKVHKGYERWVIYDGPYFSGLTLEKDRLYARGRYHLYKEGVEQHRSFRTLREARAWLNQSELERFVAAIG
jgi:hypothetical protein